MALLGSKLKYGEITMFLFSSPYCLIESHSHWILSWQAGRPSGTTRLGSSIVSNTGNSGVRSRVLLELTLLKGCPTHGPHATCCPGWLWMRPNTKSSIYLKPFCCCVVHQFSLVFVYLVCGPRQLFFFQCGPETPKGWAPLGQDGCRMLDSHTKSSINQAAWSKQTLCRIQGRLPGKSGS